jgi:hypothetical protein
MEEVNDGNRIESDSDTSRNATTNDNIVSAEDFVVTTTTLAEERTTSQQQVPFHRPMGNYMNVPPELQIPLIVLVGALFQTCPIGG